MVLFRTKEEEEKKEDEEDNGGGGDKLSGALRDAAMLEFLVGFCSARSGLD